MNMNWTQIQVTLGPVFGLIAGYWASWLGIDQAQALGIVTALAGLLYAVYTAIITRKSAMVSNVAAMPEVNNVTLNKTDPGSAALEAATPANVVAK